MSPTGSKHGMRNDKRDRDVPGDEAPAELIAFPGRQGGGRQIAAAASARTAESHRPSTWAPTAR
jgi:hypothetical protein